MINVQDSERWLASLQKSIRSQTPTLMTLDDIQDKLREAVQAHTYNIAQALAEADYANLGVISKDDFRTVMDKQICRISDEQVGEDCSTFLYLKLFPLKRILSSKGSLQSMMGFVSVTKIHDE